MLMAWRDEKEMAQIFGSAGKSAFAMGDSRSMDMLSRIVLPMLSFLLLIPVGYYLLTRGHLIWGAIVAAIYVVSIKSLEEIGLKLKKRISDADTGAKAEQAVAKALEELPDDYFVFHDLEFPGFNIDHVVVGPTGIFLVETKSQKGNITQEKDVLLKNGRKFIKDFLKQCWRQTYSLRDHFGADKLQGHTIKPILCFERGFVEIRGPVRGIAVLNVSFLRPYIVSQRENIPDQSIKHLIPALAAAVSNQLVKPSPIVHHSRTGRTVCPKCFHERTANEDLFCNAGECPKCGVIYAKNQQNAPQDTSPERASTPMDLFAMLRTLLSTLNSSPRKGPTTTPQISWSIIALKFAACALVAVLLTGTYKTIRATVTSILSDVQALQIQDKPLTPIPTASFPMTHAVSSGNPSETIPFVFEENRGQNVILLFFNTKAKTLALRACVRANDKLTTTLPRTDLGYVIVTGPAWHGYEELFGPQSEAKKALIPLSSQAKTGNVPAIQATSSLLFQKGVPSPLSETKNWVKTAFKNADGFMKM